MTKSEWGVVKVYIRYMTLTWEAVVCVPRETKNQRLVVLTNMVK